MRSRPPASALAGLLTLLALLWVQLFAGAEAWADSAPNLSVVLTPPGLPGFATAPAGPENGPINQSNASAFGASEGQLLQMVRAGTVSGYIRTWVRQPLNGDVVVSIAFWFSRATDEDQFMGGAMEAASQSGTVFPVPGIAHAYAYTSKSAGGTPTLVTGFSKGAIVFVITALNGGGDLTSASLIGIAQRQYRATPDVSATPAASASPSPPTVPAGSTPGGSAAYGFGELLGSLLSLAAICAGAVWVMRAVRRRHHRPETVTTAAPAPPPLALSGFPPTPVPPAHPAGWYPVADSPTVQNYWDGQSWIAQMRWNGQDWVTV